MRRYVVIGRKASASPDFSLIDLAGTSGRLDVLLRCLRASMLVSHGLRRDVSVYLVLLGGASAPRTLRFRGDEVRFLRPDERSLAVLAKKALSEPIDGHGFCAVRPGVAVADDGIGAVLKDLGSGTQYLVEEGGADIRATHLDLASPVFFVGDHGGFEGAFLEQLAPSRPVGVSVGPVSVHAEDAIALVSNELDRREQSARWDAG